MVILLVNAFYVLHGFSQLYQIAHLGDEDDEQECSSRMQFEEGETFYFGVRSLKNLVVVDQIDSLCPLIDCYVSGLEPFCKHFFFFVARVHDFFFSRLMILLMKMLHSCILWLAEVLVLP